MILIRRHAPIVGSAFGLGRDPISLSSTGNDV
jgi:hypothetical protein